MKIKMNVIVNPPDVPEYLKSEDGMVAVRLCACSPRELRAVGKEWTEKLLARARQQYKEAGLLPAEAT